MNQEFDHYRFLLEEEIKELAEMESRGEDMSEREFCVRDLLTGLHGPISHRHRRNILNSKLNRHLKEQRELEIKRREIQ